MQPSFNAMTYNQNTWLFLFCDQERFLSCSVAVMSP